MLARGAPQKQKKKVSNWHYWGTSTVISQLQRLGIASTAQLAHADHVSATLSEDALLDAHTAAGATYSANCLNSAAIWWGKFSFLLFSSHEADCLWIELMRSEALTLKSFNSLGQLA